MLFCGEWEVTAPYFFVNSSKQRSWIDTTSANHEELVMQSALGTNYLLTFRIPNPGGISGHYSLEQIIFLRPSFFRNGAGGFPDNQYWLDDVFCAVPVF